VSGSIDDAVDSAVDIGGAADVYKDQFGTRFIVRCDDFKLRLQANMADDSQPERLDNVRHAASYALYRGHHANLLIQSCHMLSRPGAAFDN